MVGERRRMRLFRPLHLISGRHPCRRKTVAVGTLCNFHPSKSPRSEVCTHEVNVGGTCIAKDFFCQSSRMWDYDDDDDIPMISGGHSSISKIHTLRMDAFRAQSRQSFDHLIGGMLNVQLYQRRRHSADRHRLRNIWVWSNIEAHGSYVRLDQGNIMPRLISQGEVNQCSQD